MPSRSGLRCINVPPFRVRFHSHSIQGFWLIVVSAVSYAPAVLAMESSPRFQLVGSSTLTLDQAVHRGGDLQIKAYLTSTETSSAASSPAQEGGRFSLNALLSTSSIVCYNDTIFRDDFDGDGF